jgi:hypothetical protein
MEEAGEETAELISAEGGTPITIINIEIIPQLMIFFILTLISFGILDGLFSFILFKGNNRINHEMLIVPLFVLYLFGRIASGVITRLLTNSALFGINPWWALSSLYMMLLVFSILSAVIILLFYTKIFTPEKKKAFKIRVSKAE